MSLNVKLALVISVGFITGMCWLVNRAGRPLIEEPSPLHAPGSVAPSGPRGALSAQPATPAANLFRRPSPVEPVRAPTGAEALPLAVATPLRVVSDSPREHVALPPFLASSRQPEAGSEGADASSRSAVGERRLPPSLAALEESSRASANANPGGAPPVSTPLTPELARSAPLAPVRSHDAPLPPTIANAAPAAAPPVTAPAALPATERRYTIQRGDSLATIARREWKGREEEGLKRILAANPQLAQRADRVYAGEEIVIPLAGVLTGAPRDIAASPGPTPSRPARERTDANGPSKLTANRAVASNRDAGADQPPEAIAASTPRAPDAARNTTEQEPSADRKPAAREADKTPRTAPPKSPPPSPRTRPADVEDRRVASAGSSSRGSLTAKKSTPSDRRVAASDRRAGSPNAKPATRVYTVRATDSLKTIAARELNDARRWREIAQLNGVKDPNKVLAGAKLRLPAGDRVAQR